MPTAMKQKPLVTPVPVPGRKDVYPSSLPLAVTSPWIPIFPKPTQQQQQQQQ